MNKFIVLLSLMILSGCSADLESTSMIRLIANPEDFDGDLVRVHGYFVQEFENRAIYVSSEAAQNYRSVDGIWVEFAPEVKSQLYTNDGVESPSDLATFSHKHVLIEGEFIVSRKGHFGAYSGTIINARRIMARVRDVSSK